MLNFACQACFCAFDHHDKHCLTRTFCLSMLLKLFENTFLLSQTKNVCQARICVVATNIVLDNQNFKCLPNNVCPFGLGSIDKVACFSRNIATLLLDDLLTGLLGSYYARAVRKSEGFYFWYGPSNPVSLYIS